MSTVYFNGSYGTLAVDRASGMVVGYDDEGNPPEYADIRRIDPMTIARLKTTQDDILVAGFWTDEGTYCEGMLPISGTIRHKGRADFDPCIGWEPVALLPAPGVRYD